MTGPVLKLAVLAVFGTVAALLIRRSNAEMAAALAIAVCAAALYTAARLIEPVLAFAERARALTGLSGTVFSPVLKCLGISLVARVAADVCRDGGQGAMASAVELVGAVGAVYAALPLLSAFLDMLERLLR